MVQSSRGGATKSRVLTKGKKDATHVACLDLDLF
jgi:hypothetical protein